MSLSIGVTSYCHLAFANVILLGRLPLADNNTKIVPGHGPLGNKGNLTKFRDMLVVARDRVQKLKTAGKSADEIAASKPFANLDATWGKGFFNGDVFVQVVYSTL
jgi:cyclase